MAQETTGERTAPREGQSHWRGVDYSRNPHPALRLPLQGAQSYWLLWATGRGEEPRGRPHCRPLTPTVEEGIMNWLSLTILPKAIRRLATSTFSMKCSRTWEEKSCCSALGNDGDSWSGGSAKCLARFTQSATKASPQRETGPDGGQLPHNLRDCCQHLMSCGRQRGSWILAPQPPLPLPHAPPKNGCMSPRQEDRNLQGVCNREAGLRPVGRAEEESFRPGVLLHHGHIPADLHPAAIWGGECERGSAARALAQQYQLAPAARAGDWEGHADSCHSFGSGPGRACSRRFRLFRVKPGRDPVSPNPGKCLT